ncbi:MAG: C-GCAxxG-C-C family protein [Dissulfurimicrobium sp.]|uniref:C-GCAxxG-C-C family protein n=1 Tax=Dissulfurimicrobium TaxID=1769732 RepID=UPI001EDA3509|nr:C-GCAxxG-C-C family protein [Dissulfurimicrobium hydrothermale]UKL13937.1 C-GCAxxG-C-C family protein [Dissulfurimicrobium hydrothermale]
MFDNKLSRRGFIAGASALAVGAAYAQLSGLPSAEAKGQPSERWPWPYVKLDPATSAEIAYKEWYRLYCGGAVISSIFGQLREKAGGPYKAFPIDHFIYLEGGTCGWGTICGSLAGATMVINMIVGPEKLEPSVWENHTDAILMGSEVMQWYSDANMPVFVPKNPKTTAGLPHTVSHSPLCHISVGKWMKAANKPLGSPERKDRCARVAASVTYRVVELLNEWKDGKYETKGLFPPEEYDITAQGNCEECHGSNVPTPPSSKKREKAS